MRHLPPASILSVTDLVVFVHADPTRSYRSLHDQSQIRSGESRQATEHDREETRQSAELRGYLADEDARGETGRCYRLR